MGLTDFTRFSDDPAEDAGRYISGVRLKQAIKTRTLGSPYDPEVKPISINQCYQYLDLRGKRNWSCTCPARERWEAKHGNLCLVTPEYAYVSKKLDLAPELACGALKMTMWNLNWDSWDEDKKSIKEMKWK